MHVLVTGGSGFIGQYLVKELVEHGYKVKILTRQSPPKINEASIVHGDITKPETLIPALEGVDAVFHNAAYAMDWGKKSEIYRINVEGTLNIAEACRKKGVDRIVFTSSAGVYGFPNSREKITEGSSKKPLNAYQKSKVDAEISLKKYKNLHVSIIRPPLVLGAGAKAAEIILSRLEQKKMVYIGTENNQISIVHPMDVAQCLRLALEKDEEGNTYNVVSFVCTVKELFEEISAQLGTDPPRGRMPFFLAYAAALFAELFAQTEPSLTRFRIKSLGTTRIISCERARRMLGYTPKFDLQSTVEDMVSGHKMHNQI
ncbi:MAG: SDR family NAD(P)-dependent oxidoreductase [Candidatus Thermoplasmatota archaeon]|nr:SDR family NAD(P)-dependent oxidoreductase [Candidatus Thermoplasmatota archaeon]